MRFKHGKDFRRDALPLLIGFAAGLLTTTSASAARALWRRKHEPAPPVEPEPTIPLPMEAPALPEDPRVAAEREETEGHLTVLIILFVLGGVATLGALAFLVPPSFYAVAVVFGPVLTLAAIVLVFHWRLQTSDEREGEAAHPTA